jgi:hypothetical protein
VTQQPYQQPPQGWGQPQGQPQYQQAPPQQYPQPQQFPGQVTGAEFQAGQAPPAGQDEFGTPAPPKGGGEQPALHQLKNRLLLIWPTRTAMAPNYAKTGDEEMVYFECIVLDGDPIPAHVAGDTEVSTPFAAGPKQAPFFVPALQSKSAMLDRLREFTPGQSLYGRPCLGRLVYKPSPGGRGKPWPDLLEPTDADKVLARQILPMRDQLKAAAAPLQQPQPDSFAPASGQAQQWQQPPVQQGPSQGYGQQPQQGYPGQQPAYGTPPQGPPANGYQQGPPPGWAPQQ